MRLHRCDEIYLDANATTPVLPCAARQAFAVMEGMFGNPSSAHITGLRARHVLESARSIARKVLGAQRERIVFTSGATEAIHTAIFSVLCTLRERKTSGPRGQGRYLLYGSTEHKAVPQALRHWKKLLGIEQELQEVPVDVRGQLDWEFLDRFAPATDLLCTMAVNNETGVIHDLPRIEQILRQRNENAFWIVDCVQALAKIDLNLSQTTIDYAPISGHKLYAPKGIGLLYVRDNAPLIPLLAGGGQEGGARGGTENLPGVAALAAVFQCLIDPADTTFQPHAVLLRYRDRLVTSLRAAFPGIAFNTPLDSAVPTTINFAVQGLSGKEILDLFDAAGIRVSSGSACGSAILGSYVLDAMGLPKWRSEGAIRLSFGPATSESDIDRACQRIEDAGTALRESCLVIADELPHVSERRLHGLVQLKRGSMCSWVLLDSASGQGVVIDPFTELSDRIEALIRCQNCRVLAVLDTHLHVDHASCRDLLLQVLGQRAANSAHTPDPLGWPTPSSSLRWCNGLPAQGDLPLATCHLGDGSSAEYFTLGDEWVVARTPLPGHTVDGVAFLVGRLSPDGCLPPAAVRWAFCGDTLLIGGIGRTDFYSSSAAELLHSLRRLPQIIGPDTIICPTHDYVHGFATTLRAERSRNPFLAGVLDTVAPMSLDVFLAEKQRIDSQIKDDVGSELVCGWIQVSSEEKSSMDLKPEDLRDFLATRPNWSVVDVREPHECRFAQPWEALGFHQPPENVPLMQLADFLSRLIHDPWREDRQNLIFVCRSGNRSGRAAEVARRLGIDNAWHLAGGLALGLPSYVSQEVDRETADEVEFVI